MASRSIAPELDRGAAGTPSEELYWFEDFAPKIEPHREHLQTIPDEAWQPRLLDIRQDDHAPISEIIRSTEGEIGRWPNYEVPPVPTRQGDPDCHAFIC